MRGVFESSFMVQVSGEGLSLCEWTGEGWRRFFFLSLSRSRYSGSPRKDDKKGGRRSRRQHDDFVNSFLLFSFFFLSFFFFIFINLKNKMLSSSSSIKSRAFSCGFKGKLILNYLTIFFFNPFFPAFFFPLPCRVCLYLCYLVTNIEA